MSRVAWELYDDTLDETYIFPVNPYEDNGSHGITKRTSYEVQAGMRQSGGSDRIDNIVFGAGVDLSKASYAGRVYTQDQLESLQEWVSKDYSLFLSDDLGRTFEVIIESFDLQRVRSNKHPFKHEYTLDMFILEEI